MSWIIYNAAGYRWGPEEFVTESDAWRELAIFYADKKNQVNLDRFRVEKLDEVDGNKINSTVR